MHHLQPSTLLVLAVGLLLNKVNSVPIENERFVQNKPYLWVNNSTLVPRDYPRDGGTRTPVPSDNGGIYDTIVWAPLEGDSTLEYDAVVGQERTTVVNVEFDSNFGTWGVDVSSDGDIVDQNSDLVGHIYYTFSQMENFGYENAETINMDFGLEFAELWSSTGFIRAVEQAIQREFVIAAGTFQIQQLT